MRNIIKKILLELYSPASQEYVPGESVVHKSNPVWRDNIKTVGLQVSVGECYQQYVGGDVECKEVIFATDTLEEKYMFDSTYDDDTWLIDTKCANVKWYKDKHFDLGPSNKHIVTFENIPQNCLKLVYEGTGKSSDKLKESEEEFSWVDDLVDEIDAEPIKKGDVFYIVDGGVLEPHTPLNYKPKNVRYLFFVTDIIKGSNDFIIKYQNCDRMDISYDPKKYNPTSTDHNCHYGDDDDESEIDYIDALKLINSNYWRLMGNNGYYNHLNESEDDFGWVDDLNKELVKKGDVFYIVDGTYSEDSNMYPPDYKPKNVRYLFHVTDIFKSNNRFFLNYTFCRPKNVTYNPKDYNTNSCGDFGYDEIVYENALELINSNYWRLMGNNGYYSHLTESEEDSLEWTKDLHTEPFHLQLIRDKPSGVIDIVDTEYIMFNPPVEVGDKRFNKIAYFLEDNDYQPQTLEPFGKKTSYIKIIKHKRYLTHNERETTRPHEAEWFENGRWNIGPELSEQELYNFFSQTKNGKYWAEEFHHI